MWRCCRVRKSTYWEEVKLDGWSKETLDFITGDTVLYWLATLFFIDPNQIFIIVNLMMKVSQQSQIIHFNQKHYLYTTCWRTWVQISQIGDIYAYIKLSHWWISAQFILTSRQRAEQQGFRFVAALSQTQNYGFCQLYEERQERCLEESTN